MFPCFYKQIFGMSCPLCGFQRSLKSLFKGEICDAIILFPPIFYLFFVVIFTTWCYLTHKPLNTKIAKIIYIFFLLFLVFNCIYQNLNLYQ
jgi:hypothetical protein